MLPLKLIDKFQVIAPVRADLSGGTLDLWPLYCLVPAASTINIALDLYARATFEVEEHPDFEVHVYNLKERFSFKQLDFSEPVPSSLQFPVFVIQNFLASQKLLPKIRILVGVHSSVPVGSGLGGSSSLLVAIGRGLSRLFSDYTEQGWQWRFLHWAKDTEATFLKVPTGTQDYLAAIFGGLQKYEFLPGKIEKSSFSVDTAKAFNERMVIVYSGEKHQSGLSNWDIYQKAISGEKRILEGLNQISSISLQVEKELKKKPVSWQSLGKLLNEEWEVRKKTFSVNTPTLDKVMSLIQSQKPLGVKVCGAAQGGCFLVLVESTHKPQFLDVMKANQLQVLSAQLSLSGVSIQDPSSDSD